MDITVNLSFNLSEKSESVEGAPELIVVKDKTKRIKYSDQRICGSGNIIIISVIGLPAPLNGHPTPFLICTTKEILKWAPGKRL